MMKRYPIICIGILFTVFMCAMVCARDKPEIPTIDAPGRVPVESFVNVTFEVQ